MKNFSEQLNYYINLINIHSTDLSEVSGISESTISRYRTGSRTPKSDKNIRKIASALSHFAVKNNIDLSEEEILTNLLPDTLVESLTSSVLGKHLDILLRRLDVNIKDMSSNISYDPSYISKIRNGKRKPANEDEFASIVVSYMAKNHVISKNLTLLDEITGQNLSTLSETSRTNALKNWILGIDAVTSNAIIDFLSQLDSFDLNEYIKIINFDDIKIPTAPFTLPTSKRYYGLEEFKAAELDFLKIAVTSKHTKTIYMASDIPMKDLAEDIDFGKKWMMGLAAAIKKGIHLNVIHDVDRPFDEMMMGLLSWIPLYMSGQISPFYLEEKPNAVFGHAHRYCESAAMTGECIMASYSDCMCYVTANRRELEFYEKKVKDLFDVAKPLMTIYTRENAKDYSNFRKKINSENPRRTTLLSAPPLYSMTEELIMPMLERNKVPYDVRSRLISNIKKETKNFKNNISSSKVYDILPKLTKEEFEDYNMKVYFADIFYSRPIKYTYEEYCKHYDLTVRLAKEHKNYKVITGKHHIFSNIQITILDNNRVIVSKNQSPNIHFLIQHPKMVSAISKFIKS